MHTALLKEIELQQSFFTDKTTIHTLYFGGGTPSLLKPSDIQSLIEKIGHHFNIAEDAEVTLEANPDDLTSDYLHALKETTSINRLSIGIQSFHDKDLQYMKRAHSAEEAKNAILLAQQAGFDNLSVDLIYGTPGLSNEAWKENLKTLFNLNIPHISAYALTIEEKTELAILVAKQKVPSPDDEQMAQQFAILLEETRKHNYVQYEISNFCKEPHFAKHNTNYWKGVPYLGFGPSAHSFDGNIRYWNISNNGQYLKSIRENKIANEHELLDIKDQYNEYVMTSIRTIWGIDKTTISNRFGEESLNYFLLEISPFISNRWVKEEKDIFTLTDSGKLFCDYITEHLFIE